MNLEIHDLGDVDDGYLKRVAAQKLAAAAAKAEEERRAAEESASNGEAGVAASGVIKAVEKSVGEVYIDDGA